MGPKRISLLQEAEDGDLITSSIMLLQTLGRTAADFCIDGDVTEISQAVGREIRGGSHTYT